MDYGDYLDLGPAPPPSQFPTLLECRYERLGLIGQGRFAQVFDGYDQVAREAVAIKMFRVDARLVSIRREVLALSQLRLPGVVKLRDFGRQDGTEFLVLDKIDGWPFPGGATVWSRWSALLRQTLEILSTVHDAGVLHLDLKPTNLFVGPQDQVTLLDFGLAQGPGLSGVVPQWEFRSGSRAYIAPERLRGHADARSDLFSLGTLLQQCRPRDLPPLVSTMLERMVRPDPRDRPADAESVLGELFGSGWDAPQDFVGPERLLHERSIGLSALQRCGGDPTRVLATWRRRGWCYPVSGGIRLTSQGRSRLAAPALAPVSGGLPAEVADCARGHREAGRLEQALGELEVFFWKEQVANWRGQAAPVRGLGPPLDELVLAALETESVPSLDRAACLVGRLDGPYAGSAEALLTLGRLLALGRIEKATRVQPDSHPLSDALGYAWHRLNAQLAARTGKLDQALRRAWAWVDQGEGAAWRPRVLGWQGVAAYQRGHFRQAADLQLRVAEISIGAPHTSALLNAASALMETGDLGQAEFVARRALTAARSSQQQSFEVRGEWLLRSIQYRSGDWSVDRELVAAAMELETPGWAGLVLLNEAAMAWRVGQRSNLPVRAAQTLHLSGNQDARDLALALALTSGSDDDGLVQRALNRVDDDIGWQVLGVLALRDHLPPNHRSDARRLVQAAPDQDRRRELVSPAEVLISLR